MPRTLIKRRESIQYDVTHSDDGHGQGYFYIRTNIRHYNFEVYRTSNHTLVAADIDEGNPIWDWDDILPKTVKPVFRGSNEVFLERIELFKGYLWVWIWKHGLRDAVIINTKTFGHQYLYNRKPVSSSLYSVFPGTVMDMETRVHRRYGSVCVNFSNSSFTTPQAVYSYNLHNNKIHRLQPTSKNNSERLSVYKEELRWVHPKSSIDTASQTLPIPLYVFYRQDLFKPHQGNPLLMKAYGSYGGFQEATFTTELFPLLDRGFVYAVCHPRGDGDMGRLWYTEGKYEKKSNTFEDTRDCLEFVVEEGYTVKGKIAFYGRSAGGLVAGNVIRDMSFTGRTSKNHRRGDESRGDDDGYVKVVVTQVPFIDPISDMIDPSVPWTAYEW
jgi:oligopeptidase B